MSDTLDPTQRALLYSELVVEAQRLGDRDLQLMAQRRLGQTSAQHAQFDGRRNVIPFPVLDLEKSAPSQKTPRLGMILLQSAMIPVGMAIILFAFIQVSIHIYSGPLG